MREMILLACLLSACAREPTMPPQAAPIGSTVAKAPAGPNLLTEAAYEAQRACSVVDAQSIEHCGAMQGKSPELSAARKAVAATFEQRVAYVERCTDLQALADCTWQADFDILVGLSRALDPP